MGPAWPHWAAPVSWQQVVGSCLGPPALLAAVCGNLPLVPRTVIFGASVIKIVLRFPANQQLTNMAPL